MSIDNGTQTLESMSQAIWYNQWTVKKFDKYLKGKILEVGCGIGNFTQFLVNYGQVFAIDKNLDSVKETLNLIGEKGKVGFGDIEKGEYFFNENFDTIVCINVLEHISNDDQALRNVFKLLKKQGVLILLVPSHQFLYGEIDKSIGHFRRYAKHELIRELKTQGFKILQSRRLNFLGALGWFISGRVLKENAVKGENIKIFNLIAPLFLLLEDLFEPPIGTSILLIAQKA